MATVLDMPCAAATSFDEAQNLLRGRAAPIGTEIVPLARAGGRILAKEIFARIDSPRRDSAAMDGFAVRSADLSMGITRFLVCGESTAGGSTPPLLQPGMAARVSTGAPMPPGADRVVVREHARVEGGNVLLPDYAGKSHVRRRGDDFSRGQMLLAAGTRIDARTMVVVAAADLSSVTVWRRPTLHVMVNGDELAHPGEAASTTYRVPDSLSAALVLMAEKWGAQAIGASRCGDRIDDLKAKAEAALGEADILVVAGGASHGHRDYARPALLPLGLRLAFAGVTMKPGKPLWYGKIGSTHVIGLPGNPTAALTTARLFLAPLISAVSGGRFDDALHWSLRPVLHDVEEAGSRDQFLCGVNEPCGVRVIERQQASAQMMLAQADLLMERRANAARVVAGASLRCLEF